jgi:quercetin dioxygenase-like cupin family protein
MKTNFMLSMAMAALACASAFAAPPETSVEVLLDTDETVLNQAFAYPEGRARITAARITVPPGATVPLHLHPVPLFAYILQGELIVDYGSRGTRTYRKGDAFVEAFDWSHSGRNGGRGNVIILAVYAGAVGTDNSIPESGSEHSLR